ncbi:MAG: hypothetical protein ACOY5B_09040 [Spirochaetota bacterium]
MRSADWLKLAFFFAVGALAKLGAVFEIDWLYRLFLHIPAGLLALSGHGTYSEAAGVYCFESFILDYSCAGINFFLLALATGTMALWGTGRISFVVLPFAWLLTVVANSMRVGLYLKVRSVTGDRPWLHETLGILVFLTLLIVYYELLRRRLHARKQPPL